MFLAGLTIAVLLPQPAASTWATMLREENARLERELEKLELDAMVRQYQQGRNVRVAGLPREPAEEWSRRWEHTRGRLRDTAREGRTSPEAFVELLARQADAIRLLEADRRLYARMTGPEGASGGASRPLVVDPRSFPDLAVRALKNRELRARKQRAQDELKK
jgi:hypothetical protein